MKEIRKTWDKNHPEKAKERNRRKVAKWRVENLIKRRATESKRRANKKNADGFYTEEDVLNMYEEQCGKCKYCGVILDRFHIDHVYPLSKGGSNWPSNLCLACPSCNLSKHDKTLEEWIKVRGW